MRAISGRQLDRHSPHHEIRFTRVPDQEAAWPAQFREPVSRPPATAWISRHSKPSSIFWRRRWMCIATMWPRASEPLRPRRQP